MVRKWPQWIDRLFRKAIRLFERLDNHSDLLKARLGAAQASHPEEYDRILAELKDAGVEIVFRTGECAYSPERNAPGRIILDPGCSIGAVRHEFRHFKDVQEQGFPGLGFYYRNLNEFVRLERRGYREELLLARELRDRRLKRSVLRQLRRRIDELYGR